MRLSVRAGEKPSAPPDFQGPTPAHRTAPEGGRLCLAAHRLSGQTASAVRALAVNKKRELLPGQGPASPGSLTLPSCSPRARCRNLNRLPFQPAAPAGHARRASERLSAML